MTSTITQDQTDAIASYLATHELPKGRGTEESASRVIIRWIIRIQDAAPHEMRNSPEWKRLLPLAAGTGRDLEKQRLAVAMDWMWTVVLPQYQPLADCAGSVKRGSA